MIEKIEKLIKDVQDVLKEFNMGDSTEDYIEAVKIVRFRRGMDVSSVPKVLGLQDEIQRIIDNQIRRLQ